jgi:hypothetical protein
MSEEKKVEWRGDKLANWMLAEIEEMRRSILKMGLEDVTGVNINDIDLSEKNNIVYKNEIVEGPFPGTPSKVSLDATIALMLQYGDFYVPDEAKQFIKECFDNNALIPEHLPDNEELLENGRAILDAFIEAGYSYYSACALIGATFIECAWNVHVFNDLEKRGGGANNDKFKTSGWKNCGEGLFGLTFWSQKKKIIDKLGITSPPVPLANMPTNVDMGDVYDKDYFNGKKVNHLCDLDETYWCEMAKIYLDETAKKHNEKLLRESLCGDTEYLESLAASYLWKAGCGLEPEFDKAKEMAEKYMATHKSQGTENPINSFAQQICVSIFMDQYLHGEEKLTLEELGIDFTVELANGGFKTQADNVRTFYKYRGAGGYGSTGAPNINDGRSGIKGAPHVYSESYAPLEPGIFKKNPKGFNIQAACEWINKNSQGSSQHACAKWVRMAIEAGGIPTNGRPNWAWKYIDYLPTIGFEFVQKVKKADSKSFPFEPGDIAVYQKNEDPNVPGHICMWTGRQWCSDFKQNNMIVYGGTPEAYIFRFKSTDEQA